MLHLFCSQKCALMKRTYFPLAILLSALAVFHQSACKHSPLTGEIPTDPNNPGTGPGQQPCSPDTVYFQTQVLPLLMANCARAGCHDATTRADGVVMTDYQQIVSSAEVKASKPADSKLYKVITETRPDKRMPPPPASPLSADQITLIRKWIEQGAKNNTCDANAGTCDTTTVTYTAFVQPLMDSYCKGCHSGTAPQGGISLASYAEAKAVAQTGRLYGSIAHLPGYSPMPKGSAALPACSVSKIKRWINLGMPQ